MSEIGEELKFMENAPWIRLEQCMKLTSQEEYTSKYLHFKLGLYTFVPHYIGTYTLGFLDDLSSVKGTPPLLGFLCKLLGIPGYGSPHATSTDTHLELFNFLRIILSW